MNIISIPFLILRFSRRNFYLISLVILFCLNPSVSGSQVLKDSTTLDLVKAGIGFIYNFQFREAEEITSKISSAYPGNPVPSLLNGMIIYWENYPLLPTSPERVQFEYEMKKCIDICEKQNFKDDYAENLLADLCARGLLLLFYADNDLSMEVFPLATRTYHFIRQSFNYTSVYPDFYFFTGLYNYYREKYPETYPIYKPLAILFPRGDARKGLYELQKAAKESIFLKAEASSFLSWIYAGFETDLKYSLNTSKAQLEMYPDNIQYQAVYIKCLLLEKQYDKAENLIAIYGNETMNSYFKAQLSIFIGLLQEKKYHNFEKAKQFYNNGLRSISPFGSYGNEYAAYAYFGLSRISDSLETGNIKRDYRKEAINMAEFKKINFDN